MAERPVFVPTEGGASLVNAVPIVFRWHAGMAPSQKKKNVEALHEKAPSCIKARDLLAKYTSRVVVLANPLASDSRNRFTPRQAFNER